MKLEMSYYILKKYNSFWSRVKFIEKFFGKLRKTSSSLKSEILSELQTSLAKKDCYFAVPWECRDSMAYWKVILYLDRTLADLSNAL